MLTKSRVVAAALRGGAGSFRWHGRGPHGLRRQLRERGLRTGARRRYPGPRPARAAPIHAFGHPQSGFALYRARRQRRIRRLVRPRLHGGLFGGLLGAGRSVCYSSGGFFAASAASARCSASPQFAADLLRRPLAFRRFGPRPASPTARARRPVIRSGSARCRSPTATVGSRRRSAGPRPLGSARTRRALAEPWHARRARPCRGWTSTPSRSCSATSRPPMAAKERSPRSAA